MGLFDDAGIDPDDLDTGLPDGHHPARLSNIVGRQAAQKPDQKGILRYYNVWEWSVDSFEWPVKQFFEVLPEGKTFKDLDDTDDSYNVYQGRNGQVKQTELAYFRGKYRQIKLQMEAIGAPMSASPEDLMNLQAVITTKRNAQGYANVTAVSVPGASGISLPKPNVQSTTTAATGSGQGSVTSVATGSNPFARN